MENHTLTEKQSETEKELKDLIERLIRESRIATNKCLDESIRSLETGALWLSDHRKLFGMENEQVSPVLQRDGEDESAEMRRRIEYNRQHVR